MESPSSAELGKKPAKESNPTVFDSYTREAQVFDDSMVARWKVTMNGIVIFAALFSAVVTAFIIESYKNLTVDSNYVLSIQLFQMSQQLAGLRDSSLPVPSIQSPRQIMSSFKPSPLTVLTNAFWFLSLVLGLACALIATLIQQWASDYTHAIERRQAPEARARIRAFLFEGVEASNVAAIVEGTPVLLHASLFSFFIGLVMFMRPINLIITVLLSLILAVCAAAYISSTISPLIAIASPIRTPLTIFILKVPWIRRMIPSAPEQNNSTLDEIRESIATDTMRAGFHAREQKALCWTVECLTNDAELVVFVEGIPSFLRLESIPQVETDQPYPPADPYDPTGIMKCLVRGEFAQRLQALTFSSSRRSREAAIGAITPLLESEICPFSPDNRKYSLHALCRQVRGTLPPDEYHWFELLITTLWSRELPTKSDEIVWLFDATIMNDPEHLQALWSQLSERYVPLMALAKFWSLEVQHLTQHFHDSVRRRTISNYIRSILPLAVESAEAQQAYAAALLVITTAMVNAPPLSNDDFQLLEWMLKPLCRVDDLDALEDARVVFELGIWWNGDRTTRTVVRLLQESPLKDHGQLKALYRAHHLMQSLFKPPWGDLAEAEETPDTSLGMLHPKMQVRLSRALRGSLVQPMEGFQQDGRFRNIDAAPPLFHLIATLEDPEAVMTAKEVLQLAAGPHPPHIFDSPFDEQLFAQSAVVALKELNAKTRRPEFGFITLAFRSKAGPFSFHSKHLVEED
ncbi:hypothetical protein C8J56DRAFT_252209 [Mycena floridula]|nr:hypothetical protein C8J56DRAFT_252209 [Mycena floridula]